MFRQPKLKIDQQPELCYPIPWIPRVRYEPLNVDPLSFVKSSVSRVSCLSHTAFHFGMMSLRRLGTLKEPSLWAFERTTFLRKILNPQQNCVTRPGPTKSLWRRLRTNIFRKCLNHDPKPKLPPLRQPKLWHPQFAHTLWTLKMYLYPCVCWPSEGIRFLWKM